MMKAPLALLLLCGCFTATPAQLPLTSPDASTAPDYRSRTIYFLMTDRFHPHQPYAPYVDPQYPDATNPLNCFTQSCTTDPEFRKYWGGDLQGVIEKLDYLRDLGVSAVWLTPLMENVRAYEGGDAYGTGYHGYWIQNYYRVNEHFGSWDDVNQLSRALHQNGMRYIQDITLNHSNPNNNHVNGALFESEVADNPFINSYDDDYDPANGMRYYKHYQGDARCQAPILPAADYNWSYWQLHHCLLADLSGYNQHDPAMANYLLGAGKTWIDNGVDDYRLDAVKFPFPDFIATFTRTMRNYLASLHRPSPYIVGEWSHGGVGDAKSLRFANNYQLFGTNILDFQLSFALNQFIGGDHEDPTQKITAFDLDNFLHERTLAFNGRDDWQGTFLDNHDQIRTMVRLQKLGITNETERQQRMDLASVLLMTVRGIPIIYYGDEQYLAYYNDLHNTPPEYVNSDDDDPYNRPGLNKFDEETPAFKTISTLARLRKNNPAVSQGKYITAYVDNDLLMFERVYNGKIVLVAVNRGDEKTLSVPGRLGLAPGYYTGLLQHASEVNDGNYLSVVPGAWTLHINKLSSLVLRP
ncbi:MAG TPA: alpha-amylase family glycosyl hydrolase [Bryobacteraceae bacterium]|nr:alpha-amylase family glycosyl hydrolase [Bryobacteraceae bacterium]